MGARLVLLYSLPQVHIVNNYPILITMFRYMLYYTRPRMYLFTYAYDDDDTNELYSEYHLGRSAFRVCKKGTKYCAWHREMPEFTKWMMMCIVSSNYD